MLADLLRFTNYFVQQNLPECSCIKLARPDGSSEVRALRPIAAGQECTISYLSPPLQSFQRRQRHLELQHYFTLPLPSMFPDPSESFNTTATAEGETLCSPPQNDVGPSTLPITLESQLGQLEDLEDSLDDFESRVLSSVSADAATSLPADLDSAITEGRELRDVASKLLHPRHVTLARLNTALIQVSLKH